MVDLSIEFLVNVSHVGLPQQPTPAVRGTEVRFLESTARVDSSSRSRSARISAQWALSSLGKSAKNTRRGGFRNG